MDLVAEERSLVGCEPRSWAWFSRISWVLSRRVSQAATPYAGCHGWSADSRTAGLRWRQSTPSSSSPAPHGP